MKADLADFTKKLFSLRHEVRIQLDEILRPHDLSVAEWLLLHSLRNADTGISMTDLARKQGLTKSALTTIARSVFDRSLAYRVKNPDDTRSLLVGITPLGQKHLEKVESDIRERQPILEQQLTNGNWQDVIDFLTLRRGLIPMVRLCVLQAGDNDHRMESRVPGHEELFRSMFAPFPQIDPEFIQIRHGDFPENIDDWDAFLITGGPGVYDGFEWIERLRILIKDIAKVGKPLVGICFGHQIIADTLGGKAEKSHKGWGLGVREVYLQDYPSFAEGLRDAFKLLYYHQDQVIKPPEGATVFAGDEFCPIAAYHIDGRVLGFQGHPEFTPQVMDATMEFQEKAMGSDETNKARATLNDRIDADTVTATIVNFIEEARLRRASSVSETQMGC